MWFKQILDKWSASISHTFLLHFNVNDTVDGISSISEYLISSQLASGVCDIVVTYNRSQGIGFPLPVHKDNFIKRLELDQKDMDFLPKDPVGALTLIERCLRLRKEEDDRPGVPCTAVILDYAETLVPNADISSMSVEDRTVLVTLQRWARDREISDIGNPIFLLTENLTDINPGLRSASSRVEAIKVPLPNYNERLEYISSLNQKHPVSPDITPERLAALTAGLRKVHIEDIFIRADLDNNPVTLELIKDRKEEIIRSEFGDVLEIIEPEASFKDIGGLEYVKEFYRKNVIEPIKNGNLRRVPMGVLHPGPAGTGKTILAQATAKESGLNCCALNLSRILGQYVGMSERNLEKALQCIEALAPTLVIVDELDQTGLSRSGGGDSGVSSRIFKRLLEFMSDTKHRGKIVFIGLTNRPDLIDAALKRPGRLDKKVPILAPDELEREAIFKVILQKYDVPCDITDWGFAVEATDGYTGAEIEALVLKAYEVAEDSGTEKITTEHMERALDAYMPSTKDIANMTRLAIAECNDKDLLPPRFRKDLEEERRSPVIQERRQRRLS